VLLHPMDLTESPDLTHQATSLDLMLPTVFKELTHLMAFPHPMDLTDPTDLMDLTAPMHPMV